MRAHGGKLRFGRTAEGYFVVALCVPAVPGESTLTAGN